MSLNRFLFYCSACGDKRAKLEVVSDGAIITEEVAEVDDAMYFEVTGEYTLHDISSKRFQCENCGHVVATDDDTFQEWLDSIGHKSMLASIVLGE